MPVVFLALGSNIGDRKKYIEQAIILLQTQITDIIRAPVYESKPAGYKKQENFYNSVIKGQTDLAPEALLDFVKNIEKKIGRKKRFRNGPREIDIDILLYNDLVLNAKNLIIPHPRMIDRDFVLQPFAGVSPNTIHPILKKTIQELLQIIPEENHSIIRVIQ